MPTYSLSSRNQLRSPSGAVGEAPDGPGGIAALRDDVDNFLGVAGAEYCANAAALAAIPSGRKFVGKRAYQADTATEYRWDGSSFKIWNTDWAAFTPTWTNLTPGNGVNTSVYRVREGMVEVIIQFVLGTTSAVSGTPIASLPVNASDGRCWGEAHLYDNVRIYLGFPFLNSINPATFRFRYLQVTGTTLQYSDVTATAPGTIGNLWEFAARFTYRPA